MRRVFSLLFAASLLALLFACPLGEETISYQIGDIGPSGVGKVFYVTDGGVHGLEAAPPLWNGGGADPDTQWSTITNQFANGVDALPTGMGTGYANTIAIILQNGGAASTAKLCNDYTGGTKSDWYLPSKDELAQMYVQKVAIGGFTDYWYWSSSEVDQSHVYLQNFADGEQDQATKNMDYFLRAIRSF